MKDESGQTIIQRPESILQPLRLLFILTLYTLWMFAVVLGLERSVEPRLDSVDDHGS
jgi:hypothetical protein